MDANISLLVSFTMVKLLVFTLFVLWNLFLSPKLQEKLELREESLKEDRPELRRRTASKKPKRSLKLRRILDGFGMFWMISGLGTGQHIRKTVHRPFRIIQDPRRRANQGARPLLASRETTPTY